jgi:hypothetical protein
LASVLSACGWLRLRSRPGLSRLLRRLGVRLKQARRHVHSPDGHYRDKLATIQLHLQSPDDLLFADEFTLYRQPSLAQAYEQRGHRQPLAELGYSSNRTWRLIAALHAGTGRVHWLEASQLSVGRLVAFYQQVAAAYPTASVVYLAEDNWPMHFHPDVLAALVPQHCPWPWPVSSRWPTEPSPRAKRLHLPIQLLPLPTYASWTNPTEKLWRWLQQDLLHLHRFGDDWLGLKRAVGQFLDQFAHGSRALLRYVGLSDPARLYQTALRL